MKVRMTLIKNNKDELESEIEEQGNFNQTLLSSMNSLKPEIKRLQKLRDQLRKYAYIEGVQVFMSGDAWCPFDAVLNVYFQ